VTVAIPIRRIVRACAMLGVPLLAMLASSSSALADPAPPVDVSANVLDRPVSDLAILDEPGSGATPLLVVLDQGTPAAASARISVLRRDDAWVPIAATDIDLGAVGLDARWLIGLGDGRFALIASSPRTATGTGSAVVVAFDVRTGKGGVSIDEVDRQGFDRAIEDAGAADVDGFGSAELVLGMRPLYDLSGSCGASSLLVVDGSIAGIRRSIDLPGRLAAGVLGRFDRQAGEDLLVYSSADCPPGGTIDAHFMLVRLSDGTLSRAIPDTLHLDPAEYPIPIRLDTDGSAPDEVIAMGDRGLSVFDPSDSWRAMQVAGIGSVPLVAGPTAHPGLPGIRLALLDSAGRGALVAGRIRRDRAGTLVWEGRSELPSGDFEASRWTILAVSIQQAATTEEPSNAWLGDAVDAGCPDVVLPGAILPCGTDELRSGAAWLATRPVAVMTIQGERTLLVAAGLGWDPVRGLPPGPTPWASRPDGWWRHGPSAPFALGEIPTSDLASSFEGGATSAAIIGSTTASDGSTKLAASAGARLFVSISPLAVYQTGFPAAASAFEALTARPAAGGRSEVVRMPVSSVRATGSIQEGALPSLMLGDISLPDGQPADRWATQLVPLNDWGEWGQPVAQAIVRDAVGPTIAVEEPFTSMIWPFQTRLTAQTEPGSTVQVDGIGDVAVDQRGAFAIDTELAPWPQMIRVTATDRVGNVTIGEFSIVGGVDYRWFPWPGIAAASLLVVVAARGLFGGRRDRAVTSGSANRSSVAVDDGSTPEIEELPPGSGLARG
jgi:hypothetical protein